MASIQAPDGSIVQFPDGMSDSDIAAAMAKEYGGQQATDPTEPPTWQQQVMAGPVGQAMGGAAQGLYGLDQDALKGGAAVTSAFGHYPNPVSKWLDSAGDNVGNLAKLSNDTYDRARQVNNVTYPNVGKLAGEILSPANVAASEVELPALATRAIGKYGPLVNAMVKGAAFSGTTPVDPANNYGTEKATQVGLGAALGSGGHVLGAVLNPKASLSPDVQTLVNAGVPLTTGQMLGGVPKTLEDSATSIPLVGSMIKARQREAMAGLQNAQINRSLAPIGEALPKGLEGSEATAYAQGKLGDAYDTTLAKMSAKADPQLTQDMSGIIQNATRDYGLNNTGQKNLSDILHGQIAQKSDNGFFDGNALKDVQSGLSFQARRLSKSLNPDDKNLSDALFDAKDRFNDFIARQNPNDAPALQAINKGYASYARAEAAGAASNDGISTPAQLLRAVKAGGTRGQNATGNALDQDLAKAGVSVLPSSVPDSGTAGRHMVGLLAGALAGGGEHLATGDAGLGVLTGGGALAAGASKPAQALFRALLTKRPYDDQTANTLSNLARNGTPLLASGLVPALTQSPNP